MKQIIKNLTVFSLMTTIIVACDKDEESHNEFSINIGKTVEFSKGNLQYQASTSTWRFADNQYDIIGADNSKISNSYDGWIDLFGWGTSGWDSGASAYQPYDTSTNYEDYYVGNDSKLNITNEYKNADWGVQNKIINGEGLWRTLSNIEWNYLISQRNDAPLKRGMAVVNDVFGLVILPDNWKQPGGTSFEPGAKINEYTADQWRKMESAGAVFLPAAGYRCGIDMVDTEYGYYWSVSADGNMAHYLYFRSNNYVDVGKAYRNCGLSVRLVKDL